MTHVEPDVRSLFLVLTVVSLSAVTYKGAHIIYGLYGAGAIWKFYMAPKYTLIKIIKIGVKDVLLTYMAIAWRVK